MTSQATHATLADRATGVLLGAAVGDALGVPYEFATPPGPHEEPAMLGGGLGNFAPGEWSDDTSMTLAVAQAAAHHRTLVTDDALDFVADGFLRWLNSNPADIGIQTSAVLHATARHLAHHGGRPAEVMTHQAAAYAAGRTHSAGNGALMRTAPVALAHLDDRDAAAHAATAVARLTHADPLAAESCILWVEAIRVAVTEDRIDPAAGLDLLPADRRDPWNAWLDAAQHPAAPGPVPGREFTPNGYTVTALQAAVAAITGTPVPEDNPSNHFAAAVCNAVRIGNDTDTVAAIAGALLGARWGATAIPDRWATAVHGWPGLTHTDLPGLAQAALGT